MLDQIQSMLYGKDILDKFSNITENYPITSFLYSISAKNLSLLLIKSSIPLTKIIAITIIANSLILDMSILSNFEEFEKKFNHSWQSSFLPKIEELFKKIKNCTKKILTQITRLFSNKFADNTYRKVIKKISSISLPKWKGVFPKLFQPEYPSKDNFFYDIDERDPAWIL